MVIRVEPKKGGRRGEARGGGGKEGEGEVGCVVYLTALGVNPSVLHRSGGEAVIMKKGEAYR